MKSKKSSGPATDASPQVKVWDPLVRIGHWLLVVLFFVAYLTEDDLLTLHSWAGYGIALYLLVRLLWGLIGTKYARFSDFAYGPRQGLDYLKALLKFQAKRYLGHSPAGALMVYALLACLAVTTISGIALLAVEENAGPLASWLGQGAAFGSSGQEDSGDALEEIHEIFSELTLILIIVHIVGVAWASLAHQENLVRAMIYGRKRAD